MVHWAGPGWCPPPPKSAYHTNAKKPGFVLLHISMPLMVNIQQNPNIADIQDLLWIKSRTSGGQDSSAGVLMSK